jgi:hypothetical protein
MGAGEGARKWRGEGGLSSARALFSFAPSACLPPPSVVVLSTSERGLPNFRLPANESVPVHAVVRLDSNGSAIVSGFEWPERSAEYVVRVFAAMHAKRRDPNSREKHTLLPSFASTRFRLNVTSPLQLTVRGTDSGLQPRTHTHHMPWP